MIAAAVGLPPNEIGAHSYRIRGTTNHADGGGDPTMMKARGRWDSDIAFIYARDTIAFQFESQAAMRRAASATLESTFADWVQPGA